MLNDPFVFIRNALAVPWFVLQRIASLFRSARPKSISINPIDRLNRMPPVPTSGSADFCLLAPLKATEIENYLKSQQIDIELGPVDRSGATGAITSFYFRDPDGNLIEIATTEKD